VALIFGTYELVKVVEYLVEILANFININKRLEGIPMYSIELIYKIKCGINTKNVSTY
jgi:hypothetical protein